MNIKKILIILGFTGICLAVGYSVIIMAQLVDDCLFVLRTRRLEKQEEKDERKRVEATWTQNSR